ncbi:MAG: nucleotidyltransferase domain-containing protein [Nitrososphaeria archaeon]
MNYGRVINELKAYGKRCSQRGAKAVILIGSLARGDYTAFSDADVIIVVPDSGFDITSFMDSSLSVEVEPRTYTEEQLIDMARMGRRLIREIIDSGIVLYGDSSIMKKIKDSYKESTQEQH